MKVAIIHYWLVRMRGGEKVVEALCEMFPSADIFTHVYDPNKVSNVIRRHSVRTTFIQKLPYAIHHYQKYLPLMPVALEQLDLRDYDIVISSESGPAKGVIVNPETLHVCYCHTPMRYLWDMYHYYLKQAGTITRNFMRLIFHYLRIWDSTTASRVDYFVANSLYTAKRIKKNYHRESRVIHPPVNTELFRPSKMHEEFYLMAGQMVSYKRPDLAVDAFNRSGKPLIVIGEGELLKKIKETAGPNVKVLGWQPLDVLRKYYSQCKALIFPGTEDFGIVPIEVMASGRPVIAYKKGGAAETIVDGITGLFFSEQTPCSLNSAVDRFESMKENFSTDKIVEHAKKFDKKVFKERFQAAIYKYIHDA